MYKQWKLNNGTKEKELQLEPDQLVDKIMDDFRAYGDKALEKGKREDQAKKVNQLEMKKRELEQSNSELTKDNKSYKTANFELNKKI